MVFQSLEFALFLPVVLSIYWLLREDPRSQNVLLALASCFFYAWWDWRFLPPLLLCVAVAYLTARGITAATNRARKRNILTLGVGAALGLLAYHKYFNFFIDSLNQSFSLLGTPLRVEALRVLLPVGISFYTFRAVSYMVDVYRDDTPAQRSITRVLVFISFFPYLLAGPVERSKTFLPQLAERRVWDHERCHDGCRLILWGLFKKIVVADSLAPYVNYVFARHAELNGSALAIGAIYYSLQLYADFSGYSDMALGISKLFGLTITQNFVMPFFARNIAEFWRRWHVSLSNWLRDYLYIPLGGSRGAVGRQIRNVMIVFVLSGLWHGARWTFVAWGILHGLYVASWIIWHRFNARRARHVAPKPDSDTRGLPSMLLMFASVVVAFVFFRSASIGDALSFVDRLFSPELFSRPSLQPGRLNWVLVLPAFEWLQRRRVHALDVASWSYTLRYPLYAALVLAILGTIRFTDSTAYLYFKF